MVHEAFSRLHDVADRLPSCLDPAVGTGVFLVALVKEASVWLPPSPLRGNRRRLERFACECLFGVDVDPDAIAQARVAVLTEVRRVAGFYGLGLDVDRVGEALRRHVVVGDSLGGGPNRAQYPVARAAPFDLIASNPPFVSFSGREAAPLSEERRLWLKETYATARGWPGLAPLFIELCHALLRDGGVMALVLPAAVMHQMRYAAPRAFLHASFAGPGVRPLPQSAFKGVTVPTVTVVGVRASGLPAPPDLMLRRPRWPAGHVPLSEVAIVRDSGVHTGNARGRVLAEEPRAASWVPVLRGREVTPFRIAPSRLYLDPSPRLLPGEYCRIGKAELYWAAKVLVRQTADHPIAAVDDSGAYFLNSLLALYPRCDAHALCAVLNSERVARYYRSAFPEARQRTFPQVKKSYLDALPVPLRILDADDPVTRELARLGRYMAEATTGDEAQGWAGRADNLLTDLAVGEV